MLKIMNDQKYNWIVVGGGIAGISIAEILSNVGFDWLVVDLEHTTISIEQAGELIRTIELSGVPSLVRLTSNDENQIKRVMDAGAQGIVVPMVITAEDAESAIAATRYPSLGTRGVGLARAQGYGASFQEYLSWQSDIEKGPVVIVQIEHISAVNNLKEILSVKGVDAFIIGPYDLSCSMEIPGEFDRPEFIKAMDDILQAGLKAGCPAGLHIVEPDTDRLKKAIREGYRFIAYSVDMRMLDVSARAGVQIVKEIKSQ